MRNANRVALAMIALVVTAPSVWAQQEQQLQDQWYWGGEAGILLFQTVDPNTGTIRASTEALTYGGHWLITKRRIGLHVGFDIVDFDPGTNSAVQVSPTTAADVTFSNMQRIQGGLLAMPLRGALQPYAGIGFAIQNITDAVATLPGTATQNEINVVREALPEVSSKAFAVLTGGFELRTGRLSWFGTYQYMPAGQDFLLINAQHAFLGGLRFALSAASEEIGTEK